MKLSERLEDIGKRAPVISQIIKIQNSVLFPFITALLCVLSGTSGKEIYLPCMWIFTACIFFAGIFSEDVKVFFVPFIMGVCFLGLDVPADYYKKWDQIPTFDKAAIPHFIACIVLLAIVLAFRIISSGMLREAFFKRGIFFWGIIFIDAALVLNGVLSQGYVITNLLLGIGTAVIITVCYFIFLPMLSRSKNSITYLCATMMATSYAVVGQTIVMAGRLAEYKNLVNYSSTEQYHYVHRAMLAMGWGPVTITATVIVLGIPAALYLARSSKLSFLSFFSAPVFLLFALIVNTRSAVVVGAIAMVVGIILCVTGGKNRTKNIIYTAVLLVCAVAAVIAVYDKVAVYLTDILKFMRVYSGDGIEKLLSGRLSMWKNGIADFLRAPAFGVGFVDGGATTDRYTNIYRNMYHNVFIQFLGAMGVVGLFAFLVHLKHLLEVTIRGFSAEKILLLCVPLMIIGGSLVDNFFFYPNFQIIYAVFLAAAELKLEERRRERLGRLKERGEGEKPRVVFAFVEAGMGHIVPTRTVCDAFKERYGDRAEVVESRFFTETGDKNMEKTERLFKRAVKSQNKSPVLSLLCKLGNLIAGDTFALQVLLSMTVSGVRTCPRAVRHAEELNADMIYTAHWSIPYYVARMRTPRPYTVCFCPDVCSNGAFNVDCNSFLISGEKGYAQVERVRMYAGGNITRVPFPMRREVSDLRGRDKREIREELGLAPDRFTVTLSDGGYGMARMEKTVLALSQTDFSITVVALCGTNEELFNRLTALSRTVSFELVALPFTDKVAKYIAASDLYVGKSGANSVAEPAALGVPIMITKCITYIEKNIKNYYVRDVKGAMYVPNSRRAAERILLFARDPSKLEGYSKALTTIPREEFDPYVTADLLWKHLEKNSVKKQR